MTPTVTDEAIRTALRTFLLAVLPAGVEVVRGQVNRVASPASADFAVFWPTSRPRLSTNVESWETANAAATIYDYTQATQVDYQVDVHGPASADNAQVIATLFRSPYAVTALGPNVAPLWCEDPAQMPFVNAEQQVETRFVLTLHMQANPTVSTPAQFADRLAVTIPAPVDSGALA